MVRQTKRQKVDSPDEDNRPPPAKRLKLNLSPSVISKQEPRGSKKDHLTDLSLDLIHEIVKELDPLSILRLSWTCKAFSSVMQPILENIVGNLCSLPEDPLPPCPPDINIKRYLRFALDTSCMNGKCRSHGAMSLWYLRARLCSKCLKNSPRFTTTYPNQEDLRYGYFVPTYEIPGEENLGMLRKDLAEIRAWGNMHGEHSRKWTDLMIDRLQWMNARSKYENEFHRWENRLEQRHREELQHIRNCRLDKLCDRLAEEGWQQEIDFLNRGGLSELLDLYLNRDTISDLVWKNICSKMERARKQRLASERNTRLTVRHNKFSSALFRWTVRQPNKDILPDAVDLVFMEPFKTAIFVDSSEPDQLLTDQVLFDQRLNQISREWHETRQQRLLSLIPQNFHESPLAQIDNGYGLFQLATVVFWCRNCSETLSAEAAFGHYTGSATKSPQWASVSGQDKKTLGISKWHLPWAESANSLHFSSDHSSILESLVKMYGEDPMTLVRSELIHKQRSVRCRLCSAGRSSSKVFETWDELVKHALRDNHKMLDAENWILVSDEEMKSCPRCREIERHPAARRERGVHNHVLETPGFRSLPIEMPRGQSSSS